MRTIEHRLQWLLGTFLSLCIGGMGYGSGLPPLWLAATILLLLLLQGTLIHLACHPLRQLRQWEQTSPLPEQLPAEFTPLINRIDHSKHLLKQHQQYSVQAVQELEQALNGPLDQLFQHLQDSERVPTLEERQQALQQAQRLEQLMDQEVTRVRLASQTLSTTPFNPHTELPTLIETLRQIHWQRKIEITCRIPETISPFARREEMVALFSELLEFSCNRAHMAVTVGVERSGDRVGIDIEDDGCSMEAGELEALNHRQHGSGLPICREIITHYSGEIRFSASTALGGVAISITLPTAR